MEDNDIQVEKTGPKRRKSVLRVSQSRVDGVRQTETTDGIRKEGFRRKPNLSTKNEFDVPESWIPDGFVVQWMRFSVHGQEDQDHLMNMEEVGGWIPATTDMGQLGRLMPKGGTKRAIIKKGLALYIRPKELQEESRAEDLANARTQLGEKLASIGATPSGSLPRNVNKFDRKYEQIPVDEAE